MNAPKIQQVEMTAGDIEKAGTLAARLGYEQTAYTSSSAMWGLFCLPENPARNPRNLPTCGGCIIKTAQFGLLFVQDLEDLHAEDLA